MRSLKYWIHLFLLIRANAEIWGTSDLYPCVQQGNLLLDEDYGAPRRPLVDFPLCKKFQACSCCNVSHVLTIQKTMSYLVFENPEISQECKAALEEIPCRVCDPEVGVGIKEAACRSKCRDWLSSCEDYYFGYTHISGKLMPCREDDDRNMICTKLSDLVADETEFCEAMGIAFTTDETEDCWNGATAGSTDLCDIPEPKPPFWWLRELAWIPVTFVLLVFFWAAPLLSS